MLDFGFSEILLFGFIALIVLGPERLPVVIRTVAKWYSHIRSIVNNVKKDIEQELNLSEMQQEMARLKEMGENVQRQLDTMNKNPHLRSAFSKPVVQQPIGFRHRHWEYTQGIFQTPFLRLQK